MKKRIISFICVVIIVMTVVSPASAFVASSPTPTSPCIGYVSARDGLNVRSGAGTSYSVLTLLANNSNVQVVGSVPSWFKVQYSTSGSTGYASSNYMTYDHNYGYVSNAPSGLTMRIGAGVNYKPITVIPNGTYLPFGYTKNDWLFVCWGTTTGYISGTYFTT